MFAIPPVISSMARDAEITGAEARVFLVACDYLDMIEYRELKHSVIEIETGLAKASVSRAMESLVERGYLLCDSGDDGRARRYRIPFSRAG